MRLVHATFETPRSVIVAYALAALGFSAWLVSRVVQRGPVDLALWLLAWAGLGAVALRWPRQAPFVAGLLAFLLGFVRTHRHGPNLDLGLALVLLAVAVFLLRERSVGRRLDLPALALLLVATAAVVSLAFVHVRIRGFAAAPGFGYHVFRFNAFGLSSEEALLRAQLGVASCLSWFGLYLFARTAALDRARAAAAIVAVLALNSAALLVQRHVDPSFLWPAGLAPIDRLNGVTSFCYALGDAALALFLLLPAWGATRRRRGVLTLVGVGFLLHAVVASGSRAALFSIVLASMLWALTWATTLHRSGRRRLALLPVAFAAALAAGTAAVYWLSPADQATPLGRLKEGVEREGFVGHLVTTRLDSYPLLFRVLQEYPLSGVGAGLFQSEAEKQRALLTPERPLRDQYLLNSYAANQFLNTGVELGVPALALLAAAFLAALGAAVPRRGRGSAPLLASLLVLAGALQLGPGLYNSEALVFVWLVVGLAAASGGPCLDRPPDGWSASPRVTLTLLALGLALAVVGHVASRPALAIESQWAQLRWRMNMGLQPEQPEGRWTSSEATFSVDADAPAVLVTWHVGDPAAPGYTADVTFYVDGVLAERSLARSGRVRESRLALPPVKGFKRISVRVVPPFVPRDHGRGDDGRRLGVFLHEVTPLSAAPSTGR